MKTLSKITVFLLFLLNISYAQSFVDVVEFGYVHSPNIKLKDSDVKLATHEYTFQLNLPVVLPSGDIIIFGPNAHQFDLDFSPELTGFGSWRYYGMGLNLGYRRQWNENTNTTFILVGRMNSTFEAGPKNSFQLGTIILHSWKKNENLSWKAGFYYNREFFGHFLVPIWGFTWQVNDKLFIDASLTIQAKANYELSPKMLVGFFFRGWVSSYEMGRWDTYLERVENSASLFADFYLTKSIVLELHAGYKIGRRYRVFDMNDELDLRMALIRFGDDRNETNLNVRDAPFINAKLIFRVSTDK